MNDERSGIPLKRYARVNDLIMETYQMKCLDVQYDDFVQSMKQVSWSSSASEGGLFAIIFQYLKVNQYD